MICSNVFEKWQKYSPCIGLYCGGHYVVWPLTMCLFRNRVGSRRMALLYSNCMRIARLSHVALVLLLNHKCFNQLERYIRVSGQWRDNSYLHPRAHLHRLPKYFYLLRRATHYQINILIIIQSNSASPVKRSARTRR